MRRVRDSGLETRTARAKLKARGKPYYKEIGKRVHLGYRKGKVEGKWVVRTYTGSGYVTDTIANAVADDIVDADGTHVLTFFQAQDKAREIAKKSSKYIGPYRVRDAWEDYRLHARQFL